MFYNCKIGSRQEKHSGESIYVTSTRHRTVLLQILKRDVCFVTHKTKECARTIEQKCLSFEISHVQRFLREN